MVIPLMLTITDVEERFQDLQINLKYTERITYLKLLRNPVISVRPFEKHFCALLCLRLLVSPFFFWTKRVLQTIELGDCWTN
jgi:hypothetical protein